jgi:hypothetical protein
MNHHNSRLNQRQQEQSTQHQKTSTETRAMEFAGAEEALRYDAAHTAVSPKVAERLRESIRREPQPAGTSWWRKIFGR